MSARLMGMRWSSIWLVVAAFAALWPALGEAAERPVPGFVEVEVEPAAPVVVVVPPPLHETSPPALAAAEAPAADVGPPDLPQVVVEVPPPDTQVAKPIQAAEPAPRAREPSAAEALADAIRQRVADPALPLPPRFGARDREGLAAVYGGGEPLWIKDGAWNDAARTVIDRLARAGEDALDPSSYPAPRLAARGSGPAELAEAELKLSAAAFLYARDARGGRLEPSRIGALMTPKLELPGVERVLATLAASDDPGAALQGFNPRYPGYRALRERLADIRAYRPVATSTQPRRGTILASADGGLHGRVSPRIEGDLIANMERWRWLPVRVADRHIVVNVPEFRLRLTDGGRTIHEARVITGKAATPTPIFSDLMDHAIVNPSWFVPPSILKKMNVATAGQSGYHVTHRRGVTSVRMPPGPRNALGYIKFMFPNDHAVYLHDTPNRGLFGSASRALSHGCVRVEHPFALAGKILGPQWSEGRLRGLIGYGERMIKLEERLPIHLAYFTLTVGEDGELKSFGDLYGYHGRVRRALGLGG